MTMAPKLDTLTLSPTHDGRDTSKATTAPCLFLCLESHQPFAPAARFLLRSFGQVRLGRGTARSYDQIDSPERRKDLDVRIDDGSMSSNHARVFGVLDGFAIEDQGSKNGTRVNGERITRVALVDGDIIEVGRTFFIYRDSLVVGPDDSSIFQLSADDAIVPGFATLIPALARSYADIEPITRAGLPILVTGETGTGKEVISRAIHILSKRTGACVAFNCGALPETLVEAELFGHKRGAFSDAKEDRPGLVRAADKGTLFLDEVGELRLPAQAALLRVLEEGEVRPIGATSTIKVDVQFVSATNRPLEKMVEAGSFRADLFHRLVGHVVELAALRHRREDIGIIVAALLKRHAGSDTSRIRLQPAVVRMFMSYGFPGNVRELDKALHAALALTRGGEIGVEHLPAWSRLAPTEMPSEMPTSGSHGDDPIKEELIRHFREHKGNVSAVARVMGKARMQVQRWMKRFGIDADDYSK